MLGEGNLTWLLGGSDGNVTLLPDQPHVFPHRNHNPGATLTHVLVRHMERVGLVEPHLVAMFGWYPPILLWFEFRKIIETPISPKPDQAPGHFIHGNDSFQNRLDLESIGLSSADFGRRLVGRNPFHIYCYHPASFLVHHSSQQ